MDFVRKICKHHLLGSRGMGILAVALIVSVAVFYLWANLHAPMQRDGAHFVFMANNIAHGQPPYWASWEPKNPLVEIYWSPFLRFLGDEFGLIGAARIAETLWLTVTALLIFWTITHTARPCTEYTASITVAATLMALVYLALALDVRTTDDGFNIALYQSLPELAVVALLLCRPAKKFFLHGLMVGVLIFLGWFVKQTSALPGAVVIATWLITMRDRRVFSWLAGICVGAVAGLGLFWLHLAITGTTYNYLLGSIYRTSLIPTLLGEFFVNAKQSFSVHLWELPLAAFLTAHRVWTTIAMIIMIPLAAIDLWVQRADRWSTRRVALLLCVAWMIGAWLQAVLSLLFFPHYFLASLAPVCAVAGILIANSRPLIRIPASIVAGLLVVLLLHSYQGMREVNIAAALQAPINRSTQEVLRFIQPKDKVFNYSGLPHVLVALGEPSAYPLNMNWPYIMNELPEATKTNLLKQSLADAPDVFIAMNEQYPTNQGLDNVMMTEERLKALTGHDYVLAGKTAPIPGRYGGEVSVFRRR